MTPLIDHYLRKWRLYRVSLYAFLTLNAFSVLCALVLGLNFFTAKINVGRDQEQILTELENISLAQKFADQIQSNWKTFKKIEIKSAQDEQQILKLMLPIQNFSGALQNLNLKNTSTESISIIEDSKGQVQLSNWLIVLDELRMKKLNDLKETIKGYGDHVKLLVLIGCLTLLFGFILPLVVITLMGRALNHIRAEIQRAALDFLREFTAARAGFGEEAFKNVEFWLQVFLLVGQSSSRFSSHPLALIAGEFAYLIRSEIQKKNTAKAA